MSPSLGNLMPAYLSIKRGDESVLWPLWPLEGHTQDAVFVYVVMDRGYSKVVWWMLCSFEAKAVVITWGADIISPDNLQHLYTKDEYLFRIFETILVRIA